MVIMEDYMFYPGKIEQCNVIIDTNGINLKENQSR